MADETIEQPVAASTQPPTDLDAQDGDVEQALAGAQASLDEMRDAIGTEDLAADDDAPQWTDRSEPNGIELLGDVDLHVMIELGRTRMLVEDVLRLGAGSVVELDKLAGDPVDVYVNSRLVARGEVLVLNDNFCIRISEIVADLEEQVEAAAQEESAA